jgi:hypothetical protein
MTTRTEPCGDMPLAPADEDERTMGTLWRGMSISLRRALEYVGDAYTAPECANSFANTGDGQA